MRPLLYNAKKFQDSLTDEKHLLLFTQRFLKKNIRLIMKTSKVDKTLEVSFFTLLIAYEILFSGLVGTPGIHSDRL